MPPIQAVLFDLGGTLLHYEQPPENSFEAINGRAVRAFLAAATQAGMKVPDADMAVRAVSRIAAAMEAKAARTQYANTVDSILREGLEAVGIKPTTKAWNAGLAAYYRLVSEAVQPVEADAQAVLAELTAQGRSLGLVSNTVWPAELHDADLERFGLLPYLPVRVYSSVAGMAKPHPSIYRQALDRLDVAPAEAVFVGDRPVVDIAAPQKMGMRAVLVASPYRQTQDPEIHPDARISSLSQLPSLLERWDREIEQQTLEAGSARNGEGGELS